MSSFVRRAPNNENEEPLDAPRHSRPGKRPSFKALDDLGKAEKRPRFMKSQTTTSGTSAAVPMAKTTTTSAVPRRAVLGDVTNRISVKKSSTSMGSSINGAAALAKKQLAAKRSITSSNRSASNITVSNRSASNTTVNNRSASNITVSSHRSTSSITSSSHRSASSITSDSHRSAHVLPRKTLVSNSLRSLAYLDKPTPMAIDPALKEPEEETEDHDIDSADKSDPTTCWQYAEDITKYHLETEKTRKPSSSYMARQSDINSKMRAILVDWLVDVHCKYALQPQTLHIAVHLIDHYLEKSLTVRRQRLQLVGVAALFVAAKYEEIYPPEAEDFVKITDNAYSREEVFRMEQELLAAVGYRVTFPTGYQFMKRFVKASRSCDDRVEHFAHYVVDRSLQEYKLLKYLPSTIAASAVHIARTQMRDLPAWSSTLEYHSSYKEHKLSACMEELKEMLWNTQKRLGKMSKLTAVRRKFSKERFMSVSSHPLEFNETS